ncbi:hypothetical protein WJX82_008113 [Trebouxia sp. C0006]
MQRTQQDNTMPGVMMFGQAKVLGIQKRFVVYEPSKAAPHPTAAPGQPQSGPDQIMEPSSCHQPDWDEALVQFWKRAQQEVGPLTYGQVRDQLDPGAPSCGLQNGTWQAGQCMLKAVADTVRVQDAINDSLLNKPHGFPRLYFIDGTFPGELPEGVTCQDDLPGLWRAHVQAGPRWDLATPLGRCRTLHAAATQECTEEDVAEQGDRGNKCSDVEVLLVRCLEKEIDNLDGKLKDTPWNALATTSQGLKVLQNALPVLLDLAIRAEAASSDQAGHFSKEYMHRLVYLVQKVLGTAGLDTPLHQAEAFLADLHAKKRPKGGGRSAEGRHISHMSSEVRRMVKSEQVFTVFMHLQDATEPCHLEGTLAVGNAHGVAGIQSGQQQPGL